MRMAPASGRITPAIIFRSVVLPEPLGPISPNTSPGDTDNETPLTAVRPPNALVKPSTCSSAAIASAFVVRARRDFDPNVLDGAGDPAREDHRPRQPRPRVDQRPRHPRGHSSGRPSA